MPIGYVSAGLGAVSSIANLAGGGSSGSPTTYSGGGATGASTYIPAAQPTADQYYQNIFNTLQPYATSLPGQVIPQLQQYTSNIQANPYAQQALTGATGVATQGANVANTQFGGMGALSNVGNQLITTAFDPQTALYNQLYNQQLQGSNVANEMAGVSGPYAAGLTAQNLQNFDINWQAQQLQRQIQGEQAAGQAFAGASGLGSAGLSTLGTSSALPYQTYLGQQQTGLSALSSLESGISGAFGPGESQANLLQSYLGLGQSATGLAQAGQQQGFNQQQVGLSQLGQSLSGLKGLGSDLGTLFSGGGSGGPGDFFNPASGYMGTGSGAPVYSSDPYANLSGISF